MIKKVKNIFVFFMKLIVISLFLMFALSYIVLILYGRFDILFPLLMILFIPLTIVRYIWKYLKWKEDKRKKKL